MTQKTLILIDGESALRAAADEQPSEATLFVATAASGMAACEASGISYRRLDCWTSPDELVQLGWRNYHVLHEFCAIGDGALLASIPELARRELTPLRFSYYFAKIAMDTISTKLLMVSRMVDAEKPARVVLNGAATHYSQLLSAVFEHIGVNIERRYSVADANAQQQPQASRALLGRIRDIATCYTQILQRRLSGARPYLLFNSGHDISYVMPLLAARGFRAVTPVRANAASPAPALDWRELVGTERLASVFTAGKHPYDVIMVERFLAPLAAQIPTALASYDAVAAQVDTDPVAFSLTGTINVSLADRSMMAAAQAASAPLVTYQEGAGYGSMVTPIYDYTEAREGDYLLAYGDGNAEYYAERNWATKVFQSVGSPHLDAVRARSSSVAAVSRPFTVMYVGTAVYSDIMHGPNNGLTDTYYFNSQRRIFDALLELPGDVRVIAKLHRADSASHALLAGERYDRITVEDRRFEEVCDQADLVIIDFPSTTLLIACATRARILVLTEPGVADLTARQQRRLERRARIFHAIEALLAALPSEVTEYKRSRASADIDVGDNEYLLAYGTHRGDGRSAERAADFLAHLAQSRSVNGVGLSTAQ